jgi:hypothetical protein
VVEVSGVSDVPEPKLRCVAKVELATVRFVKFPGPVDVAYHRILDRLGDEQERLEARAWLRKRGLLAKLPVYRKGKTNDVTFARELESVCGTEASGEIAIKRGAVIALKPPSISSNAIDEQTFECLLAASYASGLAVGFMGHEQIIGK